MSIYLFLSRPLPSLSLSFSFIFFEIAYIVIRLVHTEDKEKLLYPPLATACYFDNEETPFHRRSLSVYIRSLVRAPHVR